MINLLTTDSDAVHKPVLLNEVCRVFGLIAPLKYQAKIGEKPIIIDATVGGGGHASELIKKGAYVIGIDADEKMIGIAGENLRKLACPTGNCEKFFKLVNANFVSIDRIADDNGLKSVDAILFDLGISSFHFLFNKGFSFHNSEAPLDMRLSESQKVTAADLLNALPKKSLVELFSEVLPHFQSIKISKEIMGFRKVRKIVNVGDFLDIINRSFSSGKTKPGKNKISPPTLAFMALRIAVNSELDNLKIALNKSWKLLAVGGKMAVISFHSGEDGVVKDYFKKIDREKAGEMYKKLIVPSNEEVEMNPRARSAKLRVITKL